MFAEECDDVISYKGKTFKSSEGLFLTTRAPWGTDRSPEYNEHFCYKLDSRVKN